MTTLLLYYSQLSQLALQKCVPSQHHKSIKQLPDWNTDKEGIQHITFHLGHEMVWNVTHILPCCSSLCVEEYTFQFRIQATSIDGEKSAWHSLSSIGSVKYANTLFTASEVSPPMFQSFIHSEIDFFLVEKPIISATIQVFVRSSDPDNFRHSPCIVSCCLFSNNISSKKVKSSRLSYKQEQNFTPLLIPAKSQRIENSAIQNRICSPTCVSMVLEYFGKRISVVDVANKTYHAQHNLYGVWPSNIWAASQWGLLGYLLRFSSWSEVDWLLKRNIPIIVSVNYKKGELNNAAVEETQGHLLIIRGRRGNVVLVNDPASFEVEGVCREYRIEEFENVWLTRKGIGYVLFP